MSHARETIVTALLITFTGAVTGCALGPEAYAFGRSAPADEIVPTLPDSGSFHDGWRMGNRNGELIVGRLRDRTVGVEPERGGGCNAVSRFQDALIQVTRSIRAPEDSDDALVVGFFRGYLDAVRKGVREARQECDLRRFSRGNFAGALYGTFLCRVTHLGVEVATGLEVEPLYSGWSGGSTEVLSECRTTAAVTLRECGQSDLIDQLEVTLNQSCSDSE